MTMSRDEFRVHLLNLQPFQIRGRFYKLNAKGANLSMLGNRSEQVNRLMARVGRIPLEEQRSVFPEYFRPRENNPTVANRRNIGQEPQSLEESLHFEEHRPRLVRNSLGTLVWSNPNPSINAQQAPAISVNPPQPQVTSRPQTPNLDVTPRFEAPDFNSPLRLAPTEEAATTAYQITPRRQRRASITGSPAPASLQSQDPTRRRSMSVSGADQGARVETTTAGEDGSQIAKLECKICLDAAVECALMPCGHASVCYGCARQLIFGFSASRGKCPICRANINMVHRIYF